MKRSRRCDKLSGRVLVCILSLLSVAACDTRTLFHEYRSLPVVGWERGDTLVFEAEVPDSAVACRLFVEVRNRNGYPYRNLPLSLIWESPDGVCSTPDTLQLMLADANGVWSGKGWGGLFLSVFPCGEITVSRPGIYRFKLTHRLPDEKVSGINDVGLRLER